MESSRIFIRGLPSNLSVEEFKKHFSQISSVTDAKYIPHRRIGYVGYKTYDDAQKAVRYFNKSFIHMSRIGVELARPIEEQAPYKPTTSPTAIIQNVHLTEKLKQQDLQRAKSNPKLQEFLEVMQPPSKSKIWANEDSAGTGEKATQVVKIVSVRAEGSQSDEEYQHVSKKQKRSPENKEKAKKDPKSREKLNVPNDMATATVSSTNDIMALDEATNKPSEATSAVAAASDADWLRSRTSRLLGLVDDDDALMATHTLANGGDAGKDDEALDNFSITRKSSDASIQTDAKDIGTGIDKIATEETTTKVVPETTNNTGRLFIRNLSYTTSEDDLRAQFGGYGDLEEVHVAIDSRSGDKKGFGYIQYVDHESAANALSELDGKPFQGRLLHILPASIKKDNTLDEYAISKLPIKKQRQIRRKAEAASATFKWNSMYMNTDAIMSSISNRLGIAKSEIMDPTSSSSAVKQAHAETNIIQETKAYLVANGVDLDAFKKHERGDTAILVKNFSYGTGLEDLRKLFETYGSITKLLLPPSGTIAIIEFEQAAQAKSAFGALAYRKFKDSILFLEKAPKGLFNPIGTLPLNHDIKSTNGVKSSTTDLLVGTESKNTVDTSTLFVRNLNFSTTTERLREVFSPLEGFMSARVKTKPDPKKAGNILSMGFGFLEFRTKEQAQVALAAMNGYKLDGHELLIKASHKALDAAEERRKEDQAKRIAGRRTKIIIKNLPFEASKKDVRSLFGTYGQLRSVRVPKKFDSSTRGFAFADFVTAREAENAMDALKDTHLLGRRLVIDFAAEDAIDPEEEIEKMQKRVRRQADKVALQRLTGTGRRKFNVEGQDDVDND